jgi:hypothetical protein
MKRASDYFRRDALSRDGYVGWARFEAIQVRPDRVPVADGVYIVLREAAYAPDFIALSRGGWFKGKDPTVALETLRANWVEGADVLYIGKADLGRKRPRGLQKRLLEYADFGAGRPVGHWGGRLIWQLADSRELVVAWKETPPGVDPALVETGLISQFRAEYGKPPFANNPHRLGQ